MTEARYTAVYERDETNAWIVRIAEIPGCHTYGRSLAQARRRIREAMALWIDEASPVEIVDEIRLARSARTAVARGRGARLRAERSRIDAQTAIATSLRTLIDEMHLGLRDAAELLGVSHQWVQQILTDSKR